MFTSRCEVWLRRHKAENILEYNSNINDLFNETRLLKQCSKHRRCAFIILSSSALWALLFCRRGYMQIRIAVKNICTRRERNSANNFFTEFFVLIIILHFLFKESSLLSSSSASWSHFTESWPVSFLTESSPDYRQRCLGLRRVNWCKIKTSRKKTPALSACQGCVERERCWEELSPAFISTFTQVQGWRRKKRQWNNQHMTIALSNSQRTSKDWFLSSAWCLQLSWGRSHSRKSLWDAEHGLLLLTSCTMKL